MMKVVYKTVVQTFLCTCLLLGSGALARAQEPTGQQAAPAPDNTKAAPAPDNTKVNERDRSKDEPTADQQKDNRSDRDTTQQIPQCGGRPDTAAAKERASSEEQPQEDATVKIAQEYRAQSWIWSCRRNCSLCKNGLWPWVWNQYLVSGGGGWASSFQTCRAALEVSSDARI